jgi:hypothetical protein
MRRPHKQLSRVAVAAAAAAPPSLGRTLTVVSSLPRARARTRVM